MIAETAIAARCDTCGIDFIRPGGRGRPRRFCSGCRPSFYKGHPRPGPRAPQPKKPRKAYRDRREAARAAQRDRATCRHCAQKIEGRLRAFCDSDCRAAWRSETQHPKPSPRACPECAGLFQPGWAQQRYCSPACQTTHSDRIRRSRRRAAEREAAERIDPFEVFDHDGWRCQECGADTPRALRGTLDTRAPELDHIIPLARGGQHVRSNVRCLCRGCNMRKGASLPDLATAA
ncbi:HNH endonuclease [Phenylobacterium sp.]|uniref:HNH endonuclease n=1 Tax=Phenylobacterium sp. TaxID=1871053 RepID=UPI003963055E